MRRNAQASRDFWHAIAAVDDLLDGFLLKTPG
jgi:hypothetical protein